MHIECPALHFASCTALKFYTKGLERQRLIGLAVAGFNLARTITKASATGLDTGQDDYKKGICSPRSLLNNPVKMDSIDALIPLKGKVVFDLSNITKWQILFYIL